MTWFGYFMVILFGLSLFSPQTDNRQRTVTVLMIAAILFVGTGNGVL